MSDHNVVCLQCEQAQANAADSVTFERLKDGSYWCSACRSLMEGWKEDNELLVLLNHSLSDDRKAALTERVESVFEDIDNAGTTNAEAGEHE